MTGQPTFTVGRSGIEGLIGEILVHWTYNVSQPTEYLRPRRDFLFHKVRVKFEIRL